jgi:hypothetical protein
MTADADALIVTREPPLAWVVVNHHRQETP